MLSYMTYHIFKSLCLAPALNPPHIEETMSDEELRCNPIAERCLTKTLRRELGLLTE